MKLSVSLPVDDVAFLDRYVAARGIPSRSAAVHRAVELLRAEELGPAYADAWETWAADEADAWETTAGDGLTSHR
jgi:Arc/MetJ-type ribon-helix-helix transcriptional regulator